MKKNRCCLQVRKSIVRPVRAWVGGLAMILIFSPIRSQDNLRLETQVYDWNELNVEKRTSGERRQIFQGSTKNLPYFEVHATTLNPGQEPHGSHVHEDMEEMIIVKEGQVEQSFGDRKTILGPGSVVLAAPGEDHGIRNAGDVPATYYILKWRTGNSPATPSSAKVIRSKIFDWEAIPYRTTQKGGRRQIIDGPTATLSNLEMHVTTLNEGVTSHGEHVHAAEEIILVMKGEVIESIEGREYRLGPGSLILLLDEDSHGIRNAGKGQCEYFAFKWTP